MDGVQYFDSGGAFLEMEMSGKIDCTKGAIGDPLLYTIVANLFACINIASCHVGDLSLRTV